MCDRNAIKILKTCDIARLKILKTCNSEKTLMKRKICDELIAWKNT